MIYHFINFTLETDLWSCGATFEAFEIWKHKCAYIQWKFVGGSQISETWELLWQWRCPTCCDDFWLNKNQGTHNWKGEVHLHFKGPCWFEQRKKVSYARLNFLIKMDLFWWKTWKAQLEKHEIWSLCIASWACLIVSDLLCDLLKWKAGIGSSLQWGMTIRLTLGIYIYTPILPFIIGFLLAEEVACPHIATLNQVKMDNVFTSRHPSCGLGPNRTKHHSTFDIFW